MFKKIRRLEIKFLLATHKKAAGRRLTWSHVPKAVALFGQINRPMKFVSARFRRFAPIIPRLVSRKIAVPYPVLENS